MWSVVPALLAVGSIYGSSREPLIPAIGLNRRPVDRVLRMTVYLYTFLAAVHWASAGQLLNGPPGRLWCGNVITDPLLMLLNKVAPAVAGCVGALLWRRVQARRRPLLPVAILPLLFGTSGTLVLETRWLRDYGIDLTHSVWWLPWMGLPEDQCESK
jgi:hypothetical protein